MAQKYNFSVISAHEAVMLYHDAKDKRAQISVLADLLCCTVADVRKLLCERGCYVPSEPRIRQREKWAPEDVETITKMFDEGAPNEQICAAVGRSKYAVRMKLNSLGRYFNKRRI